MSLFRRRKNDDDPTEGAEAVGVVESTEALNDADHDADADVDTDGAEADHASSTPARAHTFDRSGGPFDRSEVDGPENRLDLGALWVPLVEGMELQLQMDEGTGQVTGVFVVLGDSAVQVQAFAAPRSEGIWAEVCDEIAAGITEQGGTADPGYGAFGRELLARVPSQQPDGKVGFQPLRFTGVDGPRWLLRAVFHGRAAIEPENARQLEELVAQVVVDRGTEPMGPRELLPLHLPDGAVAGEPPADADPREQIAHDEQPQGYDDLSPYERGPEITERR
ncbi:DUF3710 domain-containing protein [Angustibacter sp. Root456]|uniref:DUF3710 domain-containing protein n=1 Tax=Angustibacter sp. Root456 TaxID=1736539 RepID=UPI0006FFEE63|nr:DUF3710 domain-containing protein [Angustibacter sp. Root456]KQX66796.1 hypothetical protein ASD06_05615 [Angustibacter sp. Root456]